MNRRHLGRCVFVLSFVFALVLHTSAQESSQRDGRNNQERRMDKIQDEEMAADEAPLAPVWFSERAPEAGTEIIYYYKKTPVGQLVVKLHFPKEWKKTDKRVGAIFFHGGGWKSEAPDQVSGQFEKDCALLALRGIVAANAQYRGIDRNERRADLCVEDAKSAVRWFRGHAGELGMDPNRLIMAGGSAGGHLSLAVHTTKGYDAPEDDVAISCRPNILVLFNPAFDATAEHRATRFVTAEDARACSPIHHLDANIPPAILMYGLEDEILEEGKQYLESARKLGLVAELWTAEGQKHAFFNHDPWKAVTMRLMEQFLEKHGFLSGSPTVETVPGAAMKLSATAP